jgi:hypothetical protein
VSFLFLDLNPKYRVLGIVVFVASRYRFGAHSVDDPDGLLAQIYAASSAEATWTDVWLRLLVIQTRTNDKERLLTIRRKN